MRNGVVNGVVDGWRDGVWRTTDLIILFMFSEKSDCESLHDRI